MSDETKAAGETLDCWAIVEILGRRRFAGRISEALVAGAGMLRVDVPAVEHVGRAETPAFTKFVGMGSIYAITPVDEKTARAEAAQIDERPELPYWHN